MPAWKNKIKKCGKKFFDFCFVVSVNRRTFAADKTITAYED